MSDANTKFAEVIQKLEAATEEYTKTVQEHQEQLIGIIVWLMNKHHYTELTIPEAHHRDACQSRTVKIGFEEETVKVYMEAKPQTYDDYFGLATDLARKAAQRLALKATEHLPAIDSDVV